MDKKGFIELDEISPFAIGFGIIGALAGFYSAREATLFWKVLTVVATGIIGFVIVQKMSQNA